MTELAPAIIRAAQAGERAAQEAFVRRYAGPMRALVLRSGALGEVDDLVHDLLQKLLTALPKFSVDGPASMTTWVFTVAQRWLIDASRRPRLALVPLAQAEAVPDGGPSAHDAVERRQLGEQLEAALATLPVDLRRLFVLAQVHQRPLQELAEAEGVPVGTVKSRLHRARALLVASLMPVLSGEGSENANAR
jgi:RNA polymerase sigma-70 factor (ECF subfamily)